MKKIFYVSLLFLVLLGFWASFYFKNDLFKVYDNLGKNLEEFKKTDIGNVVNEVAKEIFTPPPLRTGGSANQVVLVKSKVIAQTNAQRFDNGMLPPLTENAKLSQAALAKAEDMFKNQYFEHVSPTGLEPGQLVKNYGYDYILSGENLILGNFANEQEVVQLWMNSPGHRANILNDRFTEIGVAIIKGTYEGQTVWIGVQEFGLPLSSCPAPSEKLKTEIESNKVTLDQLSIEISAKNEQINNTNKKSPEYNELVNEYNQMVQEYNELADRTKQIIAQYNVQINNFNHCVAGEE